MAPQAQEGTRSFLGAERTSYAVQRAIDALQDVVRERGLDAAQRVYAEVVWRHVELSRWHDGLRPRSDSHVCGRRLYNEQCGLNACLGIQGQVNGIDHPREWCDGNGETRIISSEPYSMRLEELRSVLDFCTAHNLDCFMTAGSSWFPGQTILLEMRRK